MDSLVEQVVKKEKDAKYYINLFLIYFGAIAIAALYGGNVKQDQFTANVRNYKSACEAALFRKGEVVRKVPEAQMVDALMEMIETDIQDT